MPARGGSSQSSITRLGVQPISSITHGPGGQWVPIQLGAYGSEQLRVSYIFSADAHLPNSYFTDLGYACAGQVPAGTTSFSL